MYQNINIGPVTTTPVTPSLTPPPPKKKRAAKHLASWLGLSAMMIVGALALYQNGSTSQQKAALMDNSNPVKITYQTHPEEQTIDLIIDANNNSLDTLAVQMETTGQIKFTKIESSDVFTQHLKRSLTNNGQSLKLVDSSPASDPLAANSVVATIRYENTASGSGLININKISVLSVGVDLPVEYENSLSLDSGAAPTTPATSEVSATATGATSMTLPPVVTESTPPKIRVHAAATEQPTPQTTTSTPEDIHPALGLSTPPTTPTTMAPAPATDPKNLGKSGPAEVGLILFAMGLVLIWRGRARRLN